MAVHSTRARFSDEEESDGVEVSTWGWMGVAFLCLAILATLAVAAATLGIVNDYKHKWKGVGGSEFDDGEFISIDKKLHVLNDKMDWMKNELHQLDDIEEQLWWLKKELEHPGHTPYDPNHVDTKDDGKDWPFWGKNIENDKKAVKGISSNFDAKKLQSGESSLEKQWGFTYEGEVGASATATVRGDIVYSTAYSGQIVAVDRNTGQQLWVRYGNDLLGLPPFNSNDTCSPLTFSRNAPAIFTNSWGREGIIISLPDGREASPCEAGQLPKYQGPVFAIALDRFTGQIIWKTEVHEHPWSVGTSSGSIYRNQFFAGVSSLENGFNLLAGYPCCNFTGRMYSINIDTGALIWSTPTLPDIEGYSGAGVTGSSPPVFPEAGLVFFGSGNGYSVPDDIAQCRLDNNYPDKAALACLEDGVYIDSTIALDIVTGAVRWAYRAQGVDIWTVPCVLGPNPFCPNPVGPDYDLLQSPILVPPRKRSSKSSSSHSEDKWNSEDKKSNSDDDEEYNHWRKEQNIKDYRIVAHYKSGIQYTFRAVDGKLICSRATGTAGTLGGGHWGSSVDSDKRLYIVQLTGAQSESYLLPDGSKACDGSFWAIDVDTCEVEWVSQVAYSAPPDECGELNPLQPFDEFTYPPTTGLPNNKTADGKPQKPISETALTAIPCPERSGTPTHLENSEFANAHGSLAITGGAVYGATMTGNGYALRLKDGKCITQFHCPYGGAYGGISIAGKQLWLNCGYGRLLPEWIPQPGCSIANPELCGAGCPEGTCELMAIQAA